MSTRALSSKPNRICHTFDTTVFSWRLRRSSRGRLGARRHARVKSQSGGTCVTACAFQRARSERERNFISTCAWIHMIKFCYQLGRRARGFAGT